jgi:hypothetical protein
VAEDLSLADRRDEWFTPPEGADIGIAHALDMGDELSRDFGQVFGDYEILQPFRQLGRETYALAEAERRAGAVTRFDGREASSGGVLGLLGRGWEWGARENFPYVNTLRKRLPEGLVAELWITPGIDPGDPRGEPVQTLRGLEVRRYRNGEFRFERVDMAEIDAVLVSEIIRDVGLLSVPHA